MADQSTHWGVSTGDVLALAPQVTVLPSSTVPAPTDPEYGVGTQRPITVGHVNGFIQDVASRIQAHRLVLGSFPDVQDALDALSRDALKNGAAAYVVDAAFPARSGVNDQASYGAVLWARYEAALGSMEALADRLRPGGADGPNLPQGGAVGYFPAVSVPDERPGGPAIW